MAEAKRRNPGIITMGLSWGVPGWIGDGNYWSQDNIDYHLSWLRCAYDEWNIQVDFMGLWNERGGNAAWAIELRRQLDEAGFQGTRLVAADTGWEIVGELAANASYSAAIDIIGVHYPGTPPAQAYTMPQPLWASEMWNLGVVDDWPGAGRLAGDLNQHALWGMSTSILWCLIYSWYAILPFSTPTNTNAGAGHSILTAAEPWSGHYELNPTIYAMAHHTQFALPGWTYLNMASTGMGNLPSGGTYVTVVNTNVADGAAIDFSVIIQTTIGAGSSPQTVTFSLAEYAPQVLPSVLHVWQTTQDAYFVQQPDVNVASNGTFVVTIPPDAMVSITTTTGQGAAAPLQPIPASAAFPFPYADNFDNYALQGYGKYFSDEGGIFIVMPVPADAVDSTRLSNTTTSTVNKPLASGNAYFNVVNQVPIAWETNPSPYTLIGNFNGGANQSAWTDYTVSIRAMIDKDAAPPSGPSFFATMETCSSSSLSQTWTTYQNGNGGANITSPAMLMNAQYPGMCLGVNGIDPTTPGATAVGLTMCNVTTKSSSATSSSSSTSSGSTHVWQLLPANNSQILDVISGDCLDVDGENHSVGVRAVTWPCKTGSDAANQLWNVIPGATSNSLTFQSQYDGTLCVDLVQGQPSSNTNPFLLLSSRISSYTRNGAPPDGYNFYLYPGTNSSTNGKWVLAVGGKTLSTGDTGIPIVAGTFYGMAIVVQKSTIAVQLNGVTLPGGNVTDTSIPPYGMAAFGSGWHHSWFDNFSVANNTASA